MRYISLFSGIGGFEYGIEKAYTKNQSTVGSNRESATSQHNGCPLCVGFSEIDKYAISIYKHHYPTHPYLGDVTRIVPEELPDFDFLCGGFPCQAFSIAGKRGGFEDTRGTLFFEIARIARVKRPKLLLLENVKGLLSHDNGRTFGTILATLSELGYFSEWQVLNSKDFGVPQNRERVFIVGHLGGPSRGTVFPIEINGGFFEETDWFQMRDYEPKERKQDAHFSILEDGKDRPVRIRRLTPTECERLQGYPDSWTKEGVDGAVSDSQRYKCIGNSVTTNVIQSIMLKIKEIL
jgi:DNA (cytosine-5)-methyltransferase 1